MLEWQVAIPALLILFIVVIGPFVGLMVLYFKEMRRERAAPKASDSQDFHENSQNEGVNEQRHFHDFFNKSALCLRTIEGTEFPLDS